ITAVAVERSRPADRHSAQKSRRRSASNDPASPHLTSHASIRSISSAFINSNCPPCFAAPYAHSWINLFGKLRVHAIVNLKARTGVFHLPKPLLCFHETIIHECQSIVASRPGQRQREMEGGFAERSLCRRQILLRRGHHRCVLPPLLFRAPAGSRAREIFLNGV